MAELINSNDTLMFTQEYYANILSETKNLIKQTKKKDRDINQVSELYGIYYNAFAAIIRSGTVIYRKEMEPDGYAKIVMVIGNEQYSCKDVAIRDILREEYETLMNPYEDVVSYVKPFMPETQYTNKDISSPGQSPAKAASKSKLLKGNKKAKKNKDNVNEADANDENLEEQNPAEGEIQKTKVPENYKYSEKTKAFIKELDSIGGEIQRRMIGMVASGILIALSLIIF